jgi:biopolymer transport protein ExbD
MRPAGRGDVVLVLLVIFMIVVPTLETGARAVPPRGENLEAHPEAEGDATLAIDREGRYFLNRRPVTRAELPSALAALLATRDDDHVLYVVAHRDLEYRVVRDALEVASAAGARVVGMVTERAAPGNGDR